MASNRIKKRIFKLNDYHPFGMLQPERKYSAEEYRFGFNGQEKVDEIYGMSNYLDFKYRGYNPRLGRFLAVDPLFKSYPELTTYQFASNTPIWAQELEGLEANYTNDGNKESQGEGPTNKVSGPISNGYAEELGYTKFGVTENVKNPEFNKNEIESFSKWNATEGSKGDCLPAAVGGSEQLTGAEVGWNSLKKQNAWSLGKELEMQGYSKEISTPLRNEINALTKNSGNTNSNFHAYLLGPGMSRHAIIVIYSSDDIRLSLFDQGTKWDKKGVTPFGAQQQIDDITDRGIWSGTRSWQLFKQDRIEIIYNRKDN